MSLSSLAGLFRTAGTIGQTIILCVLPFAVAHSQHGADTWGALRGAASVSINGEAIYSVPVVSPPGVASMHPGLSLEYRSGQHLGTAGQGWSLRAGLRTIHRCAGTLAQDGVASGITHTTHDKLCLDGERLVAVSGTYGLTGASYRTERASFQRIKALGGATGSLPHTFEVTDRDGTRYLFGQVAGGPDGRIEVAGSGNIRLWALSRVIDTNTNYMDYFYNEDNTSGEYSLDEIRYTGHVSSGLPPRYKIKIAYEERPGDLRTGYQAGSIVTDSQRIKRIEASFNGTIVREYHLDYEAPVAGGTNRSRLHRITECAGAIPKCRAPLDIDWQHGNSGWSTQTDLAAAVAGDRVLVGDWDGDGRDDLFIAYQTSANGEEYRAKWKIFLGKDTFSGAPVLTDVSAHDEETVGADTRRFGSVLLDYDGDGRSDILRYSAGQGAGNWKVYESTGDVMQPVVETDTGIAAASAQDFHKLALVADYNGDGLDDVIGDGFKQNTGDGFVPDAWQAGFVVDFEPAPLHVADVELDRACCTMNLNDDGIPDLRARFLITIESLCSDDDGNPDTCESYFFRWGYLVSNGAHYDLHSIFILEEGSREWEEALDINGDGLDDISHFGTGSTHTVEINTGNGFLPPVVTAAPPPNVAEAFTGDYNGDGREDRFFRAQYGNLYVMVSNGNGFEAPLALGSIAPNVITADVDGDGYRDLIAGLPSDDGANNMTLPEPFDPCGGEPGCQVELPDPPVHEPSASLPMKLRMHSSAYSDVVDTVTDGYGNFATFSYAPIASSDSYSLDRALIDLPASTPSWNGRHIVERVTRNDGIGGSYAMTYAYETAVTDTRGRGFGGFASQISVDPRNGVRSRTEFEQGFPRTGRVKLQSLAQADHTPISRTVNTWVERSFGTQTPQRTHVYLDLTSIETYEVDSDPEPPDRNGTLLKTRSIDFEYDQQNEYGHLRSVVETTTSGHYPGDSFTTTIDIAPQTIGIATNWCLDLVTSVTTTRSQQVSGVTDTSSRSVTYTPDTTYCRSDGQTRFPEQALEHQSLISYSFDQWGNLTGSVHKAAVGATFANGKPFELKRQKFVYDAFGQFVDKAIACVGDGETGECLSTDVDNPSVAYTWDYKLGLPTQIDNVFGNQTVFQYDDFGNLEHVWYPTGEWEDTEYADCADAGVSCWPGHAEIRVNVTTHSGRDVTRYLDSLRRPVGTEADIVGGTARSTIVYDQSGRVYQRSNPYLVGDPVYQNTISYDLLDRITAIDQPVDEMTVSGRRTTYTYAGFEEIVTDPLAQETKRVYDPLGRLLKSYDRAGEHITYRYDAWDALLTTINSADSSVISSEYDVRGRPVSLNDPDRGLTAYAYNPTDALVWLRDAKQQIRTYEYDALGRLTKRVDDGAPSEFKYYENKNTDDGFTRLKHHQVEPAGNGFKVVYVYDNVGRLSNQTTLVPDANGFPAAGSFSIQRSYHPDGQLKTLTYPGTVTGVDRFSVSYDYEAGMVKAIKNTNDPSEIFYTLDAADALGNARIVTMGNSLVTDRQTNPANLRLDSIVTGPSGGSTIQHLRYGWDDNGNLKSREDLNRNLKEEFFYDSRNRLDYTWLTSDTRTSWENQNFDYHSNGNISQNSGIGSYQYEETTGGGPHAVSAVLTGATTVATYHYDANGNMASRNGNIIDWTSFDKPSVIRAQGSASSLFYDANYSRYRQIEAVGAQPAETIYVGGIFERHVSHLEATGAEVIGYRQYVMLGNQRIALRSHVASTGNADGDSIVDAADNCVLVANEDQRDTNDDGFGNICDPDLDNDGSVNFSDLAIIKVAMFAMPGDPTWNPDADLNGDDSVNFADLSILKSYLWAGPGPAGSTQLGGHTHYFHQDHLSSVDAMTDESGVLISLFSYDAFGQQRNPQTWEAFDEDDPGAPQVGTHWVATTRGFTGHEMLRSVALVHMNGRVYDPLVGRFLSADPLIPNPMATQSFNRYSYTQNNPATRVDPSGFDDHDSGWDADEWVLAQDRKTLRILLTDRYGRRSPNRREVRDTESFTSQPSQSSTTRRIPGNGLLKEGLERTTGDFREQLLVWRETDCDGDCVTVYDRWDEVWYVASPVLPEPAGLPTGRGWTRAIPVAGAYLSYVYDAENPLFDRYDVTRAQLARVYREEYVSWSVSTLEIIEGPRNEFLVMPAEIVVLSTERTGEVRQNKLPERAIIAPEPPLIWNGE